MRRGALYAAARAVGAVSGAGAAAGWLWLWVDRPWGELGIATPSALLVTAIFAGLALAGLGAALKDAAVVLALVGFFSLLPVGLYLLVGPGFLPVIGACDVGMLLSGAAMVVGDRGAGAGPPGGASAEGGSGRADPEAA